MIRKAVAALTVSVLGLVTAPAAHADVICQFPVVVIPIGGPVTLICGDGNNSTTNHSTVISIDPSFQVDPHLFTPAPH